MIGKLTGILDSIAKNHAIIDVSGVGYMVYLSGKSIDSLGNNGELITLYIETIVREDFIHLYGFKTQEEKSWFNTLTTVKGVGSKVGLAILSVLNPADLRQAIAFGDIALISTVPGIGKKVAERLVTELKDKVDSAELLAAAAAGNVNNTAPKDDNVSKIKQASEALTALGINLQEAHRLAMAAAQNNADASVEEIIKLALQQRAN